MSCQIGFSKADITEWHKKWWQGDTAFIKLIITYKSENIDDLVILDRIDFLHQLCYGDPTNIEQYILRSEVRLEKSRTLPNHAVLKVNAFAHQSIAYYLLGKELECLRRAYKCWSSLHALSKCKEMPIAAKSISWIVNQGFSAFPDSWMAMLTFTGISKSGANLPVKYSQRVTDSIFQVEYEIITKLWSLIAIERHNQIANLAGFESFLQYPVLQWIVVFAATKFKASSQIEKLQPFKFQFNWYAAGEYYLQKLQIEKAESFYQKFLSEAKTPLFKTDVIYKLSLCKAIKNEKYNPGPDADRILKQENLITEADKRAKNWAKYEKCFSHPQVIKLRLLVDGGYFSQADSLLNILQARQTIDMHPSHKLEYVYRKARLYDIRKDTQEAALAYAQVILLQPKDETLYYAPFSCVRLAHFYKKYNRKKARFFANKALSYNQYAYRRSIEREAYAIIKGI